VIDAKAYESLLLSLGFEIKRRTAAMFFTDILTVVKPHHKGMGISQPLTRSIIGIKIKPDGFINLLKK